MVLSVHRHAVSALKGTFISTETWRIYIGELLLVQRMCFKV